MYDYKATVVRVVDGDTIDLLVHLGFNVTIKERFRLAGIDTPERGASGWAGATKRLTELVAGGITRISTQKTDKYGRWLATLWVDDVNINLKMAEEGYATVYGQPK